MAMEEQANYNKEYYETNKEKIQENKKNRYENDPEYRDRIKQRATDRYFKNKLRRNASKYVVGSLDKLEFDARNMRIFLHNDEKIKLVSASAFAKIIGVSTATIRNWLDNKIIPNQTYGIDGGEISKKWFSFKYIENVVEVLRERKYSDWTNLREMMIEKFEENPDYIFNLHDEINEEQERKITEMFRLTIGDSSNGIEIY